MVGLAAIIEGELKREPLSGVMYVFRAKRADRVKLLFWDGTGICLLTKRLEGSKFHWPRIVRRRDDSGRGRKRFFKADFLALEMPPECIAGDDGAA